MSKKRNILFIMADQLRADYLGCNGHPTIQTPNIDKLAQNGVNFTRAYCQAPVCGPSRMSFYTGRYAFSHGASYNNVPLNISEKSLGEYLRPLGYRVGLVGKTHMKRDDEGMSRLGINPESSRGVLLSQCGFEPFERDDGLHPDQSVNPDLRYNQYLRENGFEGDNPWHEWANSAEDDNGEVLSGWHMRNCHLPARVPEEHSETAYTTNRAIDFITEAADQPWCLHLSYIKPHWPYIAPAPYHNMYSADDILPAVKSEAERDNPHPVIAAFMNHSEGVIFSREETRKRVIPAYMGLITQLDDHIGRLMQFLEQKGILDDTTIVLTADHGDYLGDHWLGEKELFHEPSVRIPLIICDPSQHADVTRGQINNELIESIDLVPTFIELAGGKVASHILEGRSLLPQIQSKERPENWREFVVSEADYAWRGARTELGLEPDQTRAFMVRNHRWKYIHFEHFRPQLFDLQSDPQELNDLGNHPDYEEIRTELAQAVYDWFRHRKTRTTISNEDVASRTGKAQSKGYLFGVW
ncbi:MAG: alkaline phosphatase family protein [Oceanospirillales bacterium]|nr:alkaline phosphatase family protein [Oceanospirillales bacterium]MBR9886672.1 alkaline phosphatase family protein [Oceanospirillales bacterium]